MRPPSGRSKPAIIRSSVVLPQPEGPSSVKNSPASMARLTSSTAVKSPKRRVTSWISSSAIKGAAVLSYREGRRRNCISRVERGAAWYFRAMPEPPKPSLLQQLRTQSDALRAQDTAARKPFEAAVQAIDSSLWRAFRWLDEALGHLEVIRPEGRAPVSAGQILTIDPAAVRPRLRGVPARCVRRRRGARPTSRCSTGSRVGAVHPARQPRGGLRHRGAPARGDDAVPVPDRAGRGKGRPLRPVPRAADRSRRPCASSPTTRARSST